MDHIRNVEDNTYILSHSVGFPILRLAPGTLNNTKRSPALKSILVRFILILNIIFLANPAAAKDNHKHKAKTLRDLTCETDQIAKFDGRKWACADDQTGTGSGSTGYIVKDSQGKIMGGMSFEESFLTRSFPANIIPVAMSFPETNNEKILVYISGAQMSGAPRVVADTYFDDQCANTAYVRNYYLDSDSFTSRLFPATNTYFYGFEYDIDHNYHTNIYLINGVVQKPAGAQVYIFDSYDSLCHPSVLGESASYLNLNLTPLVSDLGALFPPPYTVEFQ